MFFFGKRSAVCRVEVHEYICYIIAKNLNDACKRF